MVEQLHHWNEGRGQPQALLFETMAGLGRALKEQLSYPSPVPS